jgi:hypothetical protein
MTTIKVSSSAGLLDALATADDIEVDGSLVGMPMITLGPGVSRVFVAGHGDHAGGTGGGLSVGGSLSTHGDDVVTLDVEGAIDTLKVQQGITAAGVGSDAVRLTGDVAGLGEVQVIAAHGQRIVSRTKEER